MRSIFPSINLYAWSQEKETITGYLPGAVHAKCAVADGEMTFITSANLTNAAMEYNMELGVLVTGGDLPKELHRHLESLAAGKILIRV
jgi:phosphatidylserine/phosphatidylglycerophosphate/cardiolipin synthase-like enzyme